MSAQLVRRLVPRLGGLLPLAVVYGVVAAQSRAALAPPVVYTAEGHLVEPCHASRTVSRKPVVSADEETSLQARRGKHASLASGSGRPLRVESSAGLPDKQPCEDDDSGSAKVLGGI